MRNTPAILFGFRRYGGARVAVSALIATAASSVYPQTVSTWQAPSASLWTRASVGVLGAGDVLMGAGFGIGRVGTESPQVGRTLNFL